MHGNKLAADLTVLLELKQMEPFGLGVLILTDNLVLVAELPEAAVLHRIHHQCKFSLQLGVV